MTTKQIDYIRRELRITGILDKLDEYGRNWLQHLQRMSQNRALVRAVVTLETERIRGSNPGGLC